MTEIDMCVHRASRRAARPAETGLGRGWAPGLLGALGLLWALLAWAPAWAHPGHARPGGLSLALKVEADGVRGGLNLPGPVAARLVSPPIELARVPSAAQLASLRDAARALLADTPLTANGQAIAPIIDRVDLIVRVPPVALQRAPAVAGLHLTPGPFPALQVRFHLPVVGPRSLGARWTRTALLGGEDPTVAGLVVVGERPEPFHLSAEEPRFVWHAPHTGPRPSIELTPAPAPRPLLPVALAALGLLGLAVVWRLRGPARWGLLAALAVGGVGARAWRPLAIPAPWGDAGRPAPDAARLIFEGLHQQVYAAFGAGEDAAAYDALAQAVDGPLLEWLFGQLHEGLVLRDEGGAVAQVTALTLLDAEVLPPPGDAPDDASFQVKARWQVVGEVTHYGHTHRRTQRYTGRFTVAPRPAGWRIVDLALLDQARIDATPADGLLSP